MKKQILSIFVNAMIFWIVAAFLAGFAIKKEDPFTYLYVSAIFGVVTFIIRPLLKFLTIPVKFPTYFGAALLLSILTVYAMYMLLPGFELKSSIIGGTDLYIETIPSFSINQIGTLIVGGVILAVAGTLGNWLSE